MVKKQSGLTLIEVLVSMLILGGGLLVLAGLQANSLKASDDAAQRAHALFIAQDLFGRMRANSLGVANGAYVLHAASPSICNAVPANYCADSSPSDQADVCTADQTALFDIWQVSCDSGQVDGIRSSQLDFFTGMGVALSCNELVAGDGSCTAPAAGGGVYTVEVTWSSRTVEQDQAVNLIDGTESQQKSLTLMGRL